MRLIVTGGAGFIGSAFVRYMMKRDYVESLTVFDALTYAARMENLSSVKDDPRFSFVRGDIRDTKAVDDLLSACRPDTIVNFAAESHVDRSIENPRPFISTNIEGTGVLLDGALRYEVKRFHQISTDEVYGDTEITSQKRFSETSPLNPSSPYSASKAGADLLVLSYIRTFGLDATLSRCTNNFGEGQNEEKLIPLAVGKALSGEPVPIYGTGENIREWIHADDHSAAVEAILLKGRKGEIYNIGSGYEISNIALVRKILRLMGRDENDLLFTSDRKGHDRRYALDTSKAQRELGISFRYTDFDSRLAETVKALSCQISHTTL